LEIEKAQSSIWKKKKKVTLTVEKEKKRTEKCRKRCHQMLWKKDVFRKLNVIE